jgi:hypothetical protein
MDHPRFATVADVLDHYLDAATALESHKRLMDEMAEKDKAIQDRLDAAARCVAQVIEANGGRPLQRYGVVFEGKPKGQHPPVRTIEAVNANPMCGANLVLPDHLSLEPAEAEEA